MRRFISKGANTVEERPAGRKARANGYQPSRKRKIAAGKPVGAKNCRK
jgi:hypothetical protein